MRFCYNSTGYIIVPFFPCICMILAWGYILASSYRLLVGDAALNSFMLQSS
jgi:hypothetical protein